MIIKNKFRKVMSIFLLVFTMVLSSTSVFASDINTIINERNEHTKSAVTYVWGKYNKVTQTHTNNVTCTTCSGSGRVTTTTDCNSCGGSGGRYTGSNFRNCPHGEFYNAACASVEQSGQFCWNTCPRCGTSDASCGNHCFSNCSSCNGTGNVTTSTTCNSCNGTGTKQETTYTYHKGTTSYGKVKSTNLNAYPSNSYTGNYWYVYEGIATQPQAPITITGVPEEIAYGDTFNLNATGGSPAVRNEIAEEVAVLSDYADTINLTTMDSTPNVSKSVDNDIVELNNNKSTTQLYKWKKYNSTYHPATTRRCDTCRGDGEGERGRPYCFKCGSFNITIGTTGWRCDATGTGFPNSYPTYEYAPCSPCNGTGQITTSSAYYSKGSYIGESIATQNAYPNNARHSDGYWYVYEGLSTQPQAPITITGVPDEIAYGDTFNLNTVGGSPAVRNNDVEEVAVLSDYADISDLTTMSSSNSKSTTQLHKWKKYNATYHAGSTGRCDTCNGTGTEWIRRVHCSHCSSTDGYEHSYNGSSAWSCNRCDKRNQNYLETVTCTTCNGSGQTTTSSAYYSKGSYISTVIATQNTYPQNARHSDGYWYVYEGIATQPQAPLTVVGVPDEIAYGDTFKLNVTGGSPALRQNIAEKNVVDTDKLDTFILSAKSDNSTMVNERTKDTKSAVTYVWGKYNKATQTHTNNVTCTTCRGSGRVTTTSDCNSCGGSGGRYTGSVFGYNGGYCPHTSANAIYSSTCANNHRQDVFCTASCPNGCSGSYCVMHQSSGCSSCSGSGNVTTSTTCSGCNGTGTKQETTYTYHKGTTSYGKVKSTNLNAYPSNSYVGNYWYVYEGIATQPQSPLIITGVPEEIAYGDTFSLNVTGGSPAVMNETQEVAVLSDYADTLELSTMSSLNNKSTTQMHKWRKYSCKNEIGTKECSRCGGYGLWYSCDEPSSSDRPHVSSGIYGTTCGIVWCTKLRTNVFYHCVICDGEQDYSSDTSNPTYPYIAGTGLEEYNVIVPSSYITTVTAAKNTYPQNGQSGGYWYVYEGIATQPQAPITITDVLSKTAYGDGFKLRTTGGSTSNAIVWSVTSGNATINQQGEVVTTGTGNVTVKAFKRGTPNVYYDVEKSITFNVSPKSLTTTGTITANPKEYDGELTGTVTHDLTLVGIINNDVVEINPITTTFSGGNVGENVEITLEPLTLTNDKYTLEQPTLTGYTADISVKELTIDVAVENKIYDETTTAEYKIAPTLVGIVEGGTVSLINGIPSFENKDIGTDKSINFTDFTIDGANASNYTLTQPTGIKADITGKEITLKDYSVKNKVYDGTTNAEFTTEPIIDGEFIGVGLAQGTAKFDNKNVGTGKAITLNDFSLTGENADNFTLTIPTDAVANVTKKSLFVNNFEIETKTYDGNTTATIKADETLSFNGLVSEDEKVELTIGTLEFEDENVGENKKVTAKDYKITGVDAKNYTLVQPRTVKVLNGDIIAKKLTVDNAEVKTKIYDETTTAEYIENPALVGVLKNEIVSLINGVPSFENKDIGTDKSINFTGFTIDGANASNYTLTQPTGIKADITGKEITLKDYSVKNKVYDGTTNAEFSTEPIIDGEFIGVELAQGTAKFDNKNVGIGKAITLKDFSLTGENADNFTLTIPTDAVANVTKKSLSINNFEIETKTYDGNTTATIKADETLSFNGLTSEDEQVELTIGTLEFEDENTGENKRVTAKDYKITGADAKNYVLVQPRTGKVLNGDIIPKKLTVDNILAENKIYDGNTTAEYKENPVLVGLLENEIVSLTNGKISFADKNAGDEKQVVYSDFSIDNSNYSLTQPRNTTAKITPLDIEISDYKIEDKLYDGTTKATIKTMPQLNETIILSGDIVTIESYNSIFDDKNVGTEISVKTTIILGGKDKSNYTISNIVDVNADITPKNIVVTDINIKDKYYDTTLSAEFETTPKLSGTINKDDVDLIVGTPTFENENAEKNKNIVIKDFELTGLDAKNYSLTQPKLTGEISPKPISVTVDKADKLINEKDPDFTFSNDKLYADDEINGSVSRVKGEEVGEYNFTVGTLKASDNYQLNVSTNEKFEIKKGETELNLTLHKSYNIPTKITINAMVEDDTDGRIEFYLNGKRMTSINVINGQAEFVFRPLKAGYYSVNAVLVDSSSYNNVISNIVDFTVTDEELGIDEDKDKDCDGSCKDKDCDKDCTDKDCDGSCKDKDCDEDCTDKDCDGSCKDKDCDDKNCTDKNCDGSCKNDSIPDIDCPYDNENDSNNGYGNKYPIRPPVTVDEIKPEDDKDSIDLEVIIEDETQDDGSDNSLILDNLNAELIVIDITSDETLAQFPLGENEKSLGVYNAKLFLDDVEIIPYDEVLVAVPMLDIHKDLSNIKAVFADGTELAVKIIDGEMVFTTEQLGDFSLISVESQTNVFAIIFLILLIIIVILLVLYFIKRQNK